MVKRFFLLDFGSHRRNISALTGFRFMCPGPLFLFLVFTVLFFLVHLSAFENCLHGALSAYSVPPQSLSKCAVERIM